MVSLVIRETNKKHIYTPINSTAFNKWDNVKCAAQMWNRTNVQALGWELHFGTVALENSQAWVYLTGQQSIPEFMVTRRTVTQRQTIVPNLRKVQTIQIPMEQENKMWFCLQQNQWTLMLNARMWKNSRGQSP